MGKGGDERRGGLGMGGVRLAAPSRGGRGTCASHMNVLEVEQAACTKEMMTMALGTLHWMAPELLDNKQYSLKVDVYSFAVVMW